MDGHNFYIEKRARDSATGTMYSRVTDTIHSGVSERYTLILDGGAGGVNKQPGDYLYHNGIARRFKQGAWGIMRVLPKGSADLQPLPNYTKPAGTYVQPAVTGLRPPVAATPGNPCPAGAINKTFAISAVDVPDSMQGTSGSHGTSTNVTGAITAAYVMSVAPRGRPSRRSRALHAPSRPARRPGRGRTPTPAVCRALPN